LENLSYKTRLDRRDKPGGSLQTVVRRSLWRSLLDPGGLGGIFRRGPPQAHGPVLAG
jgi:hypothetical protein